MPVVVKDGMVKVVSMLSRHHLETVTAKGKARFGEPDPHVG